MSDRKQEIVARDGELKNFHGARTKGNMKIERWIL